MIVLFNHDNHYINKNKKSFFFFLNISIIVLFIIFSVSLLLSLDHSFAQSPSIKNHNQMIQLQELQNSNDDGEENNGLLKMDPSILLKMMQNVPPYSNIKTISFVDGLHVTGVDVGQADISITLEKTKSKTSSLKDNTPITVLALRLPLNNVKDLLILKLQSPPSSSTITTGFQYETNTSSSITELKQKLNMLFEQNNINVTEYINPLQALMGLAKNSQTGTIHIVGADWDKSRTVTTGLLDLGSLFGMQKMSSVDNKDYFILTLIMPFIGKTNLGSVPLR